MPEENPSHYLEDWKTGVEITPRASRPHRSSRVGQSVVVALTVMALLAAGIFIGLSINKSSLGFVKNGPLNSSKDKAASKITSPADHSSPALAINSLPPSSPARDVVPNRDSIVATAPTATVVNKAPAPKVSAPARERSVAAAQKPQPAVTIPRDSLPMATPAIHRESSHRSDLSEEKVDKDVIRNNLSNLVSLGASGYTVGTFGGISGLQLTVSNRSVHALDLVVVEVQYIQANKKVFKTENLYFRDIAPGSALMQQAPKSSRGIKIQYKITLVNSKELGLSYSAL
jgi:cytoskeletal protein RodZ